MIADMFKKDSVKAFLLALEISLFSYILLTQVSQGKELTEIKTENKSSIFYMSQQLNRIESNQVELNHSFDDFKQLVLRNLKITNG
jgi:hypothetical protein